MAGSSDSDTIATTFGTLKHLGRSNNVLGANSYVEGKITPVTAKLIQARDKAALCEFQQFLILFGIEKKKPEICNESPVVPVYEKDDKTNCSIYQCISMLSATKIYPTYNCQGYLQIYDYLESAV
jgi:hypothetical protein